VSEDKVKLNVKVPDSTKTQEQLDRETSVLRLQAEQLRLEREQLELKKLRSDIEKIDAEKARHSMSHETVEESLRYGRQDREWHENACTHMKGGSSESLLNGAPSQGQDASNYAMIDHTLTTGVRFRLCQRCGRTWFPKDPDYRWAMSRPSKNSPSTGCPSPGLVRNHKSEAEGGPRMTSEIPHKIQKQVVEPEYSQGPAGY
jgi:hypothetical protein